MNAKATGTNRKKFLKNFQKPLDKPLKMWYNIYRKGQEKSKERN